MKGVVFDIQRGAMHDGPGLRTTVFLKGCPLRCRWCHNPESWSPRPQRALPAQAGEPCVVFGRGMSVGEIMDEVRKDRVYYESSGGGLTISGGEPTVQFAFCRALLKAARAEGLHTALDTCGYNSPEVFEELLPDVSLFLWDFKATGGRVHRSLTGVSPDLILRNFEMLYEKGAAILLRCPLIPGVNDGPEHLEAISRCARRYPRLVGIEVLPYHTVGMAKYDRLGIPRPKLDAEPPGEELLRAWRGYFAEAGGVNPVMV